MRFAVVKLDNGWWKVTVYLSPIDRGRNYWTQYAELVQPLLYGFLRR